MTRHPSPNAPKQQGGVLLRVDTQAHAAPFDGVAFAGDQILDRARVSAAVPPDLDIAEMEPEFVVSVQRNGDGDASWRRRPP